MDIKLKNSKAILLSELTCKLSRACERKESSFAAIFSLTPTEFKCLRLFAKKSTVPIKEMIDELDISAGRVTHILSSLERKNYIVRRIDKKDKRNRFVDLTPKSRKFINELTQKHIELHKNILSAIGIDKQELVTDVIDQLIKALENWTDVNKEKLS